MAKTRTVDFLPEIFQTSTNQQFLSATLDQLVQEPQFKKTQGFVGQRVGPGVNPNDTYVIEPNATRTDYQLEPGVISLVPETQKIKDAITYPGITDALATQGGITNNAQRLYTSDYYTWDPFVNFDKFVNYNQYYWLPAGPLTVDVSATPIPLSDNFDVTRSDTGYTFSGSQNENPVVTLVRGGNYTFHVGQTPYRFWIQSAPGVTGRLPETPNISSRNVLGVTNNGDDNGIIAFNVPLKNAQEFYYNLTTIPAVDLITDLQFNQINNVYLDQFLEQFPKGIDNITDLDGRTVIFTNQIENPDDGGWLITTQFDPLVRTAPNQVGGSISYDVTGEPYDSVPYETQTDVILSGSPDPLDGYPGSYDSIPFDMTTPILTQSLRYSVWLINYVKDNDGNVFLRLNSVRTVNNLEKFNIRYGSQWSNTTWYKNANGYFQEVPLLTAIQDVLYYQDSTNPALFGEIHLVEQSLSTTLDVTEIIGRKSYTSPNGVAFSNNLKIQFLGNVYPESYKNNTYYVSGVGTAIQLLPTQNYVTPETYTISASVPYDSLDYDVGNFDASLNQPEVPDYLTMALDSPSLNAWSRSNRWFHIDVINASATYNKTTVILDNNFRAKRPILEFRGGLKLFNMGTEAKTPVNIIDFSTTDALSTINGKTGYGVDGYSFINGTRVIFAADQDSQVRNKIYEVQFIEPNSDGSTLVVPIINLVPASDATVKVDQCVVVLSGQTQQGLSYYFDGSNWIQAQQKTSVNQAPLFDVFDLNGVSFGNKIVYPSTNFVGSKLFSYALGTGYEDPVLGIALKYLSLTNVGDIVFNNNLYTDTFIYVKDKISTELAVSNGFVKEYVDRTNYTNQLGWQNAVVKSKIYQQFSFTFDVNKPLQLDVKVVPGIKIPSLKVYIGAVFQDPHSYTVTTTENTTTVVLANDAGVPGDIVEILALSDQTSKVGFYQVPVNLENNPLNENSSSFTLGTIRTHYETIGENLVGLEGKINGPNNSRDLGNIIPYGLNILQQSSPITMAGYFMRSAEYNIFSALEYNSREYEKFKAQMLSTAVSNEYSGLTVPEILTDVIQEMISGKTELNPFYWSDMAPTSTTYTQSTTTYTVISTPVFDTVNVYNYTSSNYQGLLVYVNDVLLVRNRDYVVATDGPRLTITIDLVPGDIIAIQEYDTTYGSFIPNTPTKLGLYPAFVPELYLDVTYVQPTWVIRGHDGSITVAFNDFRDELLLEFEKRIYNNIKLDGNPIPLSATEVIPGQFRTTDYSLSEVTQILSKDFLTWIGWNKLDYKTQNYIADNAFTWNYSTASNKLTNNQPLVVGAWRGIYNYFYDTTDPNSRPWEMLGFSIKPTWWEKIYGPAPYTSGNLVLWDDLELGLVRDPAGIYILPQYARPGLTSVIPSGTEGKLLSPFDSVVANYNSLDFQKSWTVGDDGPVESAWKTSSSYPFALMRLLALTRPAEFFSLFADRDLYRFNTEFNQYLYNDRYRLDANGVQVYGNGVSKASYIDWIVDYNRQLGIDSTTALEDNLSNLDVRLCYRMASFSAKNLLQIYTEKSSPNSLNSSLLIPDESYNLLFYKNVPFDTLTYSSVIVQGLEDGTYAVYGYGTVSPYFRILASKPYGITAEISAGGTTVTVPVEHSDTVIQVPYGYVFTNKAGVVDFLLSYGKLLEKQGMIFDAVENGHVLNWQQMAQEFLYWSNQGWAPGNLINLNPNATQLVIERPMAIVDGIRLQTQENLVLNQDRRQLTAKDLVIDRIGNSFKLVSLSGQTINFMSVNFVTFENMVVLDNKSIFADLIYEPVTGARQSRIKIAAATTLDWNGQLDAPGFVLNQDNIQEWEPNKKYARGEIVTYKNYYYSAVDIVQPSAEFNFDQWTKSDYTRIQQGLLPNLPNKSNQLANSYNVYSANLEQDQDLFSYGLIGFRPRQYMAALNLDDVSQVNLYRQFLGTKGTVKSAELFTFADLGRGVAEYAIHENWAVQRAVYGANANRSYYELQLNEALLQANPSLIQVIVPGETSRADQTVYLGNVFKESYKLTSPNILTTTYTTPTDISLPTAGYVNLDDVDITVFDISNPSSLNANLDNIGIGTTIWAAKINSYNWGIYHTVGVPGRITNVADNFDGTSVVTFNKIHGLSPDDLVVIKFFSTEVNGVYKVVNTPSIYSITIEFSFPNGNQVTADGNGLAFKLESERVAQASDVINLPYSKSLLPGERVWVDNNGQGHWEVLEKQQVFTPAAALQPTNEVLNSNFGTSVSQARQNIFLIAGAPDYVTDGSVFTFIRNELDELVENSVIEIGADETDGFGKSTSVGYQTWIAAGAPNSHNNSGYVQIIYRNPLFATFESYNLLTAPFPDQSASGEFGTCVQVSADERWLYVGAPGINAVYAYGLVEIENQQATYITDGITNTYLYNDKIVKAAAAENQLLVVLNNQALTVNVDYIVNDDAIRLITTPPSGLILLIARRNAITFTATLGQTVFSLDEYLYNATNINSFYVTVDGVIQRPNIDYEFNSDYSTLGGRDLIFFSAPGLDAEVTVSSHSYYQFVHKIEPTSTITASISGLVMTVTSVDPDADELTVGMKISGTGIIQGTHITEILTGNGGAGTYKISMSHSLSSRTLVAKLPDTARFGSSISCATDGRQVMIGCPGDASVSKPNTGSVYVYDRAVQRVIVSNSSVTTYQVDNADLVAPTMVLLNNQFLKPTEGNIDGTFTVLDLNNDGKNDAIQIVNTTLDVGDLVDIEVNAFNKLQKFYANNLFQGGAFGADIDVCINNCSIYVGSPTDGGLLPEAGSVDRHVNQSRVYGITTSLNPNPSLQAGDTIRINNIEVAVPAIPNNTVQGLADAINASGIPNVIALVGAEGTYSYGLLTLAVKNSLAATGGNKLTVLPGLVGKAFYSIGFETYPYTQTIVSPAPLAYSNFGQYVNIDTSATTLIIGAPRGNIYRPNTFDGGTTYFDAGSTDFNGPLIQTGAIYSYDYLPSATDNINNPGLFVFGQQIYDEQIQSLDRFGTSIDYTDGKLAVGAPGSDIPDSTQSELNYGRIALFNNLSLSPAWVPVHVQQPVVDIRLINSVFTYDKITSSKTEFFDFFDPLQGKILGAARQNIDFIGASDPASYNVGLVNNQGNTWAAPRVGQVWWNTNTVRFINPNQDDIVYASRRWGQVFPGSTVDIYQWIASSTPPATYTGEGTPLNIESYSVTSAVNNEGTITTTYYFWVKGLTSIDTTAGKTLSVDAVSRYIEDPKTSGIPYVAFVSPSATAIYNANGAISASDTIISIEFDRIANQDDVHAQYDLIPQDRADGWLSEGLYRKLQDSFCGTDSVGNKVPDPTLSPANRYGVQFRPRQSMFGDRFLALKNYLLRANSILGQYPIVETANFDLLNSKDPEPTSASGEWDKRVANLEILSFQRFAEVPVGYKYLVESDSRQGGLWTIYEVTANKTYETLELLRVQNYYTPKYWQYINWYLPGYNSSSKISATVKLYTDLSTLTVPVGSSVKVTTNSAGKWEIYLRTLTGWDRVGLQDGTIEFKAELWDYQLGRFGYDVEVFDAQYFDQEPVIETRKIIQAINEELLIGNLLIERNRSLMLMFNFVLTEFQAPEWLTKTSLIDVEHKIRQLLPFQVFQQDNQDFVIDYIQEVKPYHVQVRELNLIYDGLDTYQGTITDFDNPAYYNTDLLPAKFTSPVLLPYTHGTAVGTGTQNTDSDASATAEIWSKQPWTFWFDNYTLELESATVLHGGAGYLTRPIVEVVGDCTTPAEIVSRISSDGRVVELIVINPGQGYVTTPTIVITGGSGSGATAYPNMSNSLVRNLKTTIKYDRYQYSSPIVEWQPNTTYTNGTQVRYVDKVWSANNTTGPSINSSTFDPFNWELVPASELSGVDRTMGFYVPAVDQPGLDLPLLIDGIDYPGVQVSAPGFNQDSGFDVGNYDINPYDNISYGPEGQPTYDPAILDAIYESPFTDPYLGLRPTDINVDGGEFVGPYESHAPEELVPGIEYDTLDFRVYTRPGADWIGDGHGFPIEITKWEYAPSNNSCSFAGIVPNPVQVRVVNQDLGLSLIPEIDYTVDWVNEIVTVVSTSISTGSVLVLSVYGIGGGNQLYKNSYPGTVIGNSLVIPVTESEIMELVIFVNGQTISDFSFAAQGENATLITFDNSYTAADYINVTVLGATDDSIEFSWSSPQTQYFVANGVDYTFELDAFMGGTNSANMIVEKNGQRARPPEGVEYIADNSSAYELPYRGGYSQSLVADNDVSVWVDNQPQVSGVDFVIEPYTSDEDHRAVEFLITPPTGAKILISVSTKADYTVITDGSSLYPSILSWKTTTGNFPTQGDIVAVTTWNDTQQQNIVTQVFQGPITTGVTANEPYDTTDFDAGNVTNDPGSFDYTLGYVVSVNDFMLNYPITNPTRLWVTLNGVRKFYGDDFLLNSDGTELILHGNPIKTTDVMVITLFTNSVVPEAMAFRIFQDMREVQATYRITGATTTELLQPLTSDDDIIYVRSVAALTIPDLTLNIWGVLTVDGERIMYRYIDIDSNTVSGLRRGTAGTAIFDHDAGALVYNLGRDNLLSSEYQDHYVTYTTVGDGSTTTFIADNIDLSYYSSSFVSRAVQVYVGGVLKTTGYTITGANPVTVQFASFPPANIPPSGQEVTVQIRQGKSWYQPGPTTPSDGQPLQETHTKAALFLQGK